MTPSDENSPMPTEDFEDLYENAPCGHFSMGEDGVITRVNDTFARWTGFSPDELVGRQAGRYRDADAMAVRLDQGASTSSVVM